MNKKILITLILGLFLLSFASATTWGTYKQGEEINLVMICPLDDCNETNITSITYPNSNSAVSNVGATHDGNTWNYTFNSTEYLGKYKVYGVSSNGSVGSEEYFMGDFEVTKNGTEKINEGEGTIIWIAMIIMLLFSGLFFVLSMKTENQIIKIIFFGVSAVILFMASLFSMSLIDNLLTEYTTIIDGYSTYIMVFKIILSMAILSVTLYAGWFSLKLYKFKRGFIDE